MFRRNRYGNPGRLLSKNMGPPRVFSNSSSKQDRNPGRLLSKNTGRPPVFSNSKQVRNAEDRLLKLNKSSKVELNVVDHLLPLLLKVAGK